MTERETLKLALEALETSMYPQQKQLQAITAIKEALAQPEQEPVAYGMWDTMLGKDNRMMMVRLDKGQDGCTVPLYTTPPHRKPLTDKQILADETLRYYFGLNGGAGPVSKQGRKIVNAIEALHNIKETEK